jgi:hypothetical protein
VTGHQITEPPDATQQPDAADTERPSAATDQQTLDLPGLTRILPRMAKTTPTGQSPPSGTAKQAAKAARVAREAAALRANLHKRKAQARALAREQAKQG